MPETFLEAAVAMAHAAGAIQIERLESQHDIVFKGDIDLVTEVDRLCEECILSQIAQRFPGHAVVAEESGRHLTGSEYCWYVDPLDGTTNYAHRFPFFAVSIALAVGRQLEVGVIYNAASGELFSAQRGKGAFLNGRQISVSKVAVLNEALLGTGFPPAVRRELTNITEFVALLRKSQAVRRPGSAALDLAFLAAGRLDGFWEYGLSPWDVAAGALMVTEAGGVVSGIRKGDFQLEAKEILASNGLLHPSMQAILLDPPPLVS